VSARAGEAIELFETDSGGVYTDEYVVRGHVDRKEFVEAIALWLNQYRDDDVTDDEIGPTRHRYARWCFQGDDAQQTLQTYSEPARGRFRVTTAYPQSAIDEQARIRLQGEADHAFLAARYPGIEVVESNAYGRHYKLRVPGLAHSVTMTWFGGRTGKMGELRGWAHGDDVAAWDAFRERCRATLTDDRAAAEADAAVEVR
jgi:hypothetical protein